MHIANRISVFCLSGLIIGTIQAAEPPKPTSDAMRIQALVERLASKDFAQRERATDELRSIGSGAIPQLREAVKSTDAEVRRRANACIQSIEDQDPIGALVVDLKSHDVLIRRRAAQRAGRLRLIVRDTAQSGENHLRSQPSLEKAVLALAEALEEKDDQVVRSILTALSRLGRDARIAIPKLRRLLTDQCADDSLRSVAALVLGHLKAEASAAIPELLAIIRDDNAGAELRSNALAALLGFGSLGAPALPDIIRLAEGPDVVVRCSAIQVLGTLGKDQAETVDLLLRNLTNESKVIRRFAARSLGEVGKAPERCVPALMKALKDEDRTNYDNLEGLLLSLYHFGSAAREAVPAVYDVAKDEGFAEGLRQTAINTLVQIGGSDVKRLLETLAQGKRGHISTFATQRLKNMKKMEQRSKP